MVDIVPRRQQLQRRRLQQLHDAMDSALDAVQDVVVHLEEVEAWAQRQHTEAIVDDSKDDSPGVDGLPEGYREMNEIGREKVISASDWNDRHESRERDQTLAALNCPILHHFTWPGQQKTNVVHDKE